MSKVQLSVSVRWMMDREIAVCAILNRISRPTTAKKFFVLMSVLGDGGAWYALILTLPIIYGASGLATSWNMAQVALLNLVLYKIIKELTGRPRPCAVCTDITLATAPLDQYSFPSGHTMHAVAFSMIATAHHPELALLLVPFSTLIALSRIVLGLHYPTDVIAGGFIGGFVASILVTS